MFRSIAILVNIQLQSWTHCNAWWKEETVSISILLVKHGFSLDTTFLKTSWIPSDIDLLPNVTIRNIWSLAVENQITGAMKQTLNGRTPFYVIQVGFLVWFLLNQFSCFLEYIKCFNFQMHDHPSFPISDCAHRKRRRNSDPKVWEVDSEQEEHSHSLSQNSSPSQSDQEQNMVQKLSSRAHDSFIVSPHLGLFKQQNRSHHNCQLDTGSNQVEQRSNVRRTIQDFPFVAGENQRQQKTEQFIRAVHTGSREVLQCSPADQKPPHQRLPVPPLVRSTANL